jgi:hypothetical protein
MSLGAAWAGVDIALAVENDPHPTHKRAVTVRQAISDLPGLYNGASEEYLKYPIKGRSR